jgi:FtsH-binding integral membrane protein
MYSGDNEQNNYIPNQNFQNNDCANQNYQPVPYSESNENDLESGNQGIKNNYELTMRLGFIRKVYGILSTQLLVTFLLSVLSMTSKTFSSFQLHYPGVLIFSVILSTIMLLGIMCYPSIVKQSPTNYIFLGIFTLCESYLVSFICSVSSPRLVFMAASMTVGITLVLTYYACTTKEDFTLCGSLLFIGAGIMMMFSIFLIFTQNRILHIIMCCFGVGVYSLYLVYDTQLLLGNKRSSLDYDDYIIGALMLYVDIIQLFLNLLEILQYFNGEN